MEFSEKMGVNARWQKQRLTICQYLRVVHFFRASSSTSEELGRSVSSLANQKPGQGPLWPGQGRISIWKQSLNDQQIHGEEEAERNARRANPTGYEGEPNSWPKGRKLLHNRSSNFRA
ncbi:predicted protein [Histoplasma capsulatum var. duboisii H88]|uniref:Predicted protein n=1 Tax=Ajellomyces capsulatus (strain H88) TaxID=544711 RepID=F0UIA9_AJEC8|nr:predicted protein [Histoplasma capsulatum var. duboisii H88]